MAEVRADGIDAHAATKQAWDMKALPAVGSALAASAYMIALRGSSGSSLEDSSAEGALCMGVNGVTAKNPLHGQIKVLPCNSTDTNQQWSKKPASGGGTSFSLHQGMSSFGLGQEQALAEGGSTDGCLDLQRGEYIMEIVPGCDYNQNQMFLYNETSGQMSFASGGHGKVLDVC
jgi:hypothetical protein